MAKAEEFLLPLGLISSPQSSLLPHPQPLLQVWLSLLLLKTSMICYTPCGPLIPSQGSRGADLQTGMISHHC